LVFCLYTNAFLELDFGTHTQTWDDEYDTYIIDSKTLNFDFTDFSNSFSLNVVIPAKVPTNFFFDKPVIGNTTDELFADIHSNKLFIKNKVFII
jgi:hypothetical protein